jgi:hypothetical protein
MHMYIYIHVCLHVYVCTYICIPTHTHVYNMHVHTLKTDTKTNKQTHLQAITEQQSPHRAALLDISSRKIDTIFRKK